MVDINKIYGAIIAAIPVTSSLTCAAFLLTAYTKGLSSTENTAKRLFLIYFIQIFLQWILTGITPEYSCKLRYLLPFKALNFQIMQVTFYHAVFLITSANRRKRKFSIYHYLIPVGICLFVCLFFYKSLPYFSSCQEAYRYFNPYFFISFLIYSFFYIYKIIKCIFDTLKDLKINGIAEENDKITWLIYVVFFRVLLAIIYIFSFYYASYIILYALFIPVQHIILIYNILQRNYSFKASRLLSNNVIITSGRLINISEELDNKDRLKVADQQTEQLYLLSQTELENYFRVAKPYLNPNFKMDDLIRILGTNRAYLSKFINQTYEVNFSNYVNIWRLNELDIINKQAENKDKDLEELVKMVGFGSLRNYWRVRKKLEDKKNITQ